MEITEEIKGDRFWTIIATCLDSEVNRKTGWECNKCGVEGDDAIIQLVTPDLSLHCRLVRFT